MRDSLISSLSFKHVRYMQSDHSPLENGETVSFTSQHQPEGDALVVKEQLRRLLTGDCCLQHNFVSSVHIIAALRIKSQKCGSI